MVAETERIKTRNDELSSQFLHYRARLEEANQQIYKISGDIAVVEASLATKEQEKQKLVRYPLTPLMLLVEFIRGSIKI